MNVEAVAWIAQRNQMLAALFLMLSVLWFVRAEEERAAAEEISGAEEKPARRRSQFVLWFALSLAAFLLAILSKISVASMPLALVLILWWLHGRVTRWDLLRTLPFFGIALALILVQLSFQHHGDPVPHPTLAQRIAGAGTALWFYLGKALAPINQAFIYPHWDIRTGELLWWLPLAAALAVTLLLGWRALTTSARWPRGLFLAWAYCCVALAPALGLIQNGFMMHSLVADRYLHLAIIGVIALLAAAWSVWRDGLKPPARGRANILAVIVLGTLLLLTFQRSRLFGQPARLLQASLELNPNSYLAEINLAIALGDDGRHQEALWHCRQADRLQSDSVLVHHNWAVELLQAGQFPEAVEKYRDTLRLIPDEAYAHRDLAVALFAAGRPQEATAEFETALRLDPDNAQSHYELGVVLAKTGRLPEAIQQFHEALRLRPTFAEARNNLGSALLDSNQVSEAAEQFEQALRINPDYLEAYANSAIAYARLQRRSDAITAAQKAANLARAVRNESLAKQIEAWLTNYRAQQSTP